MPDRGELEKADDQEGVQVADGARQDADGGALRGAAEDERRRHEQLVQQARQDEDAELPGAERDVDGQRGVAGDAGPVAPVMAADGSLDGGAGHLVRWLCRRIQPTMLVRRTRTRATGKSPSLHSLTATKLGQQGQSRSRHPRRSAKRA